jgi:hypothetical protein
MLALLENFIMKHLKTSLLAVIFAIFTLPAALAQIGATWTPVTGLPAATWRFCASSTNAAKLVIDGQSGTTFLLYTSTNSGATWTYRTNLEGSIVSSADGTTLAVADSNNQIYISTNSGVTWNPTSVYSPNGTQLAGSLDAKILMAPGLGLISTNSGTTWTPLSAQGPAGACSSDGTKLAVAVLNDTIYVSTNSGASWTPSGAPTSDDWQSLAMSADGNTLIACTLYDDNNDPLNLQRGEFYFSTDAGTSWTEGNYGPENYSLYLNYWESVAISADGRTMAAASIDGSEFGDIPGLLLTSTDSGATWEPASLPTAFLRQVAVSADGTGMMALAAQASGGAYINIGNSAGTPALNISTAGGGTLLSWPFLTPGYVLQQNTNLATTNWVTVTNAPAVVNQVISAPAGPNNFYRLAKP